MTDTKRTPTLKCGGSLVSRSFAGGRARDRVACPFCSKPVLLREPFNGAQTQFVQIPLHNRAARAKAGS